MNAREIGLLYEPALRVIGWPSWEEDGRRYELDYSSEGLLLCESGRDGNTGDSFMGPFGGRQALALCRMACIEWLATESVNGIENIGRFAWEDGMHWFVTIPGRRMQIAREFHGPTLDHALVQAVLAVAGEGE